MRHATVGQYTVEIFRHTETHSKVVVENPSGRIYWCLWADLNVKPVDAVEAFKTDFRNGRRKNWEPGDGR